MKNSLVAITLINFPVSVYLATEALPGDSREYTLLVYMEVLRFKFCIPFISTKAIPTPECYLVEACYDVRKARHDENQIERFIYLDPCDVAGFVAVLLLFLLLLLPMLPYFLLNFMRVS